MFCVELPPLAAHDPLVLPDISNKRRLTRINFGWDSCRYHSQIHSLETSVPIWVQPLVSWCWHWPSTAIFGFANHSISAKWHFLDGVNLRNLQIQNVSEVSKDSPRRWQESFALQTKREELAKQQQPSISLGPWRLPDRKRSL